MFRFGFLFEFVFCSVYQNVPGAYRGQKRTLDPLELESQKGVNHHVYAWN